MIDMISKWLYQNAAAIIISSSTLLLISMMYYRKGNRDELMMKEKRYHMITPPDFYHLAEYVNDMVSKMEFAVYPEEAEKRLLQMHLRNMLTSITQTRR